MTFQQKCKKTLLHVKDKEEIKETIRVQGYIMENRIIEKHWK